MRTLVACLLLAAVPAWGQAPAPSSSSTVSPQAAKCPECGVVRSVRNVVKETRSPPVDNAKPSGLVASIPLGSGGGKSSLGSSTQLGKDAVPTVSTWEVIVRYDDGRFTLITADDFPDVKEGDRVRVEKGQLVRRNDD
jgi:hypothetical protein